MTKIKNSSVLITGAASGLGKLMALECLKDEAFHVYLVDINQIELELVDKEFKALGYTKFSVHQLDVSNADFVTAFARKIHLEYGAVEILINNAGVVIGKNFVEHSIKDIQKTINVNVLGPMYLTQAFLPVMLEHGSGHIVNIASASGLIANPKMSVYAASKWAVIGWSESLRLELEHLGGDFHVTTVEPSYINTGMFDGVKAPLLTPILEPEYIVGQIMKGIKNNEILIREPFIVNSLPLLRGLLPTRAFDYVAEKLGVYNSMDDFKGRSKP